MHCQVQGLTCESLPGDHDPEVRAEVLGFLSKRLDGIRPFPAAMVLLYSMTPRTGRPPKCPWITTSYWRLFSHPVDQLFVVAHDRVGVHHLLDPRNDPLERYARA